MEFFYIYDDIVREMGFNTIYFETLIDICHEFPIRLELII